MACDCTSFDCIEVFRAQCSEEIVLPVAADETATWKMVQEFNGQMLRTDISVADGENLVLPAGVFNENYTHTVRFYKADGSVFNNKCYTLKIMATVFTNPSSGGGSSEVSHVVVSWEADGNTHTDPRFQGRTPATIDYGGVTVNEDISIAGTTLTVPNDIPENTKVTIHFA
jgi:hypothetical protein